MPPRANLGSSYASHSTKLDSVLSSNAPWGGDPHEIGCWPPDKHNASLLDAVAPLWRNPAPVSRDAPLHYDLVAIGAGAGGLVSAKQSSRRGFRSALIEKHLAGGDCLNVGCVPSKALLRAAKAAKERRGASMGMAADGSAQDFSAVMARLRECRTKVSPADSYSTAASVGAAVFRGAAVFTGPNSMLVTPSADSEDQEPIKVTFGKCVIAVGGTAAVPTTIKNLENVPFHTNASLYNLTALPPRVVVLGGGPIGLEMAQAFALLGSKVTVLLRSARPLPREDPDAAKAVTKALEEDGVTFLTEVKTTEAAVKQNDGKWTMHRPCHDANYPLIAITYEDKAGKAVTIETDLLLVATGRKANTAGLGLELASVNVDVANGGLIVVNDLLQSPTNPNVYAVGDCASTLQFTHVAGTHAQMVVDNALFGGSRKVSDMVVPWCTFTEPEVAHVGAYAHDHPDGTFDTYTSSLSHNDRAICDGDDNIGGLVKVHCWKGTETIAGATVVAPHAGEMISEITVALQFGIPLGQKGLGGVIHPYPTVSDAVGGCGHVCKMGRWSKVAEGGDAKAPMSLGEKDTRTIVKATHQELKKGWVSVVSDRLWTGLMGGVVFSPGFETGFAVGGISAALIGYALYKFPETLSIVSRLRSGKTRI